MSDITRMFLRIIRDMRREWTRTLAGQALTGVEKTILCAHGEVKVRLHRAKRAHAPALFQMHGGGFVWGDAAQLDKLSERICEALDITVIDVNYRKAPEYPYPAAVEDVCGAMSWFYRNAAQEGLDPEGFAAMGYSCGGSLAAIAAIRAAGAEGFPLRAQILHYPYLDAVTEPALKQNYPTDLALAAMEAFRELYCREDERNLPEVSPVCAPPERLAGTAPALIVGAEWDSLNDEAKKYTRMLQQAGVEAEYACAREAHHGYIEDWANRELYELQPEDSRSLHSNSFPRAAQDAIDASLSFLKEKLGI